MLASSYFKLVEYLLIWVW